MENKKLNIIANMVVRLTELKQRECPHLCVENFAATCFAKLLSTYREFS